MPRKDRDPVNYRTYMRRYMRLRRLLQRKWRRYKPFLDERSCVPVRVVENFALWGQPFTPGEVYRLRWEVAARLEAACLVELVRSDWLASSIGRG